MGEGEDVIRGRPVRACKCREYPRKRRVPMRRSLSAAPVMKDDCYPSAALLALHAMLQIKPTECRDQARQ